MSIVNTNNKVCFATSSFENYIALEEKDDSVVYFITDDDGTIGRIYVGGTSYSTSVTSISYNTSENTLVFSVREDDGSISESTVSVDLDSKQDVLTAGTNISIINGTISTTAEVNVQADWDETSTTSDSFIQNKPENLPNKYSLVINSISYDGSESVNINVGEELVTTDLSNYVTLSDLDTYIDDKISTSLITDLSELF